MSEHPTGVQNTAGLEPYPVRIQQLHTVYVSVDADALAAYKSRFPNYWRQDVCSLCASNTELLQSVFAKDAAGFLDGLESLFAPTPRELAYELTQYAITSGATACAEWLFRQPRPQIPLTAAEQAQFRLISRRVCTDEESNGDKVVEFLSAVNILPAAKLRTCMPKMGDFVMFSFTKRPEHICDAAWVQMYQLLFDNMACFYAKRPLKHKCGSSGVLCRVLGEKTCPGCFARSREDLFVWQAILKMPPTVLSAIAPWLFMLNADNPLLEAAAAALANNGGLAEFRLFSRLKQSSAYQSLCVLATRVAGNVLWNLAPTEHAWAEAEVLIDNFAADMVSVVPPAGAFLTYIVAVLRESSKAGRILELFLQMKNVVFGFVNARWAFAPTAVTPAALARLVEAAGLLYESGCQQPHDFANAVAQCLRDHPARTPALTAAMDLLGHFSWTRSLPQILQTTVLISDKRAPNGAQAYPSTCDVQHRSKRCPDVQRSDVQRVSCLSCLSCWR